MAKNDVILLDGIIDQRLAQELPSSERDEVFEFLVLEETLKDYDLSREEIELGWIDGRNDGGFDGVYILINGHLLEDTSEFIWPRAHASIDVWLITCKHHPTFVQATLDSVLATIQELFNLSRTNSELHGSYSDELFAFRSNLEFTLRRLSIGRPKINFHIIYGSRGDTTDIGESVAARSRQIEAEFSQLFSSCSARFYFVGACELVELHRKSKTFSIDLPFLEHLATGKNSYVLLVRLEDYWKFVTDGDGNLRRYLFDSNVRDYLGSDGVNEDIARSLADETAPDFWWLNNGVTILATNATVPGKTIQIQDIQIVNGLQTTETIFGHFQSGSTISRDRALLVKIIVSSNPQARDRIIRATNNQSPVEVAALHATDKIQRDIEAILEKHEWYYERRKNYYRNIGKSPTRFVTPIYLASAVVSLIFKNPSQATRLKSKFMRTQEGYDSVFSAKFPIEVWPVLANIYKSVDTAFSSASPLRRGERFIRNWRPLVAFLAVARRMKTFAYNTKSLVEISNNGEITNGEVAEIIEFMTIQHSNYDWKARASVSFFQRCCEGAAQNFGLAGLEEVGRRSIKSASSQNLSAVMVSPELLEQVDMLLPNQPWKPGIHLEVAKKVDRKPIEISAAIQKLIEVGRRKNQIDGVVYDPDGKVFAFDPERVRLIDPKKESESV
jgi:AIPR protein